MKTIFLTVFILFVALFSTSVLAQADWEIVGDGKNVQSDKPYYLKVKSNGKFLTYKSRNDPGINLDWERAKILNLNLRK